MVQCMYVVHFKKLSSPSDGHLGCFYLVAIGHNAAVNAGVQERESLLSIPLNMHLELELLGHVVILFNFFEESKFFHSGCTFYISTGNTQWNTVNSDIHSVLISPHTHQCLSFFFPLFFTLAILLHVN